jgi:hypothetical protein
MKALRATGHHVGMLVLALAVAGCSSEPGSSPTTSTPASDASTPMATSPVGTTSSSPSDTSEPPTTPVVTYPDDWFDIELTSSIPEAHPGDTVNVTIVCPHRGTSFAAPFEVVHPDLTFAQQEVRATATDRYSTSFLVPYWLEPSELELHGGCPRPPDPCDDTDDCPEYTTDPTPILTLPLTPAGDGAWDSWRAVSEPYLDPTAEVGATLPGGAIVTALENQHANLDARVGDRIQVTAQCPLDAEANGTRFVIVPEWTLARAAELGDDSGWSIIADPDHPGRYVVSLDTLQSMEEVLGEPLSWFVEVAPLSVAPGDSANVIIGEIPFEAGFVTVDDGALTGVYITALCEDVGMPFDPRSIDIESTQFPVQVLLSDK